MGEHKFKVGESLATWRDGIAGEYLPSGTKFKCPFGDVWVLETPGICRGQYIERADIDGLLVHRERDGWSLLGGERVISTPCRGVLLPSRDASLAATDRYNPLGLSAARRLEEEALVAVSQQAEDDMLGRRAALVAKLEAEHVKSAELSGLLHPRDYWSTRLRGGRRHR